MITALNLWPQHSMASDKNVGGRTIVSPHRNLVRSLENWEFRITILELLQHTREVRSPCNSMEARWRQTYVTFVHFALTSLGFRRKMELGNQESSPKKASISEKVDTEPLRGTSSRQNRDSNRNYLLPHILPLISAHGPPCLQPEPKNGHYPPMLLFPPVVPSIGHLPLIESAA